MDIWTAPGKPSSVLEGCIYQWHTANITTLVNVCKTVLLRTYVKLYSAKLP